jgi:WD40 repeat protein
VDSSATVATFSPDGRQVLLGFTPTPNREGKKAEHLLSVYEADSGKKRYGLPGFEKEYLLAADFSPDGRFLLTVSTDKADADQVRLWDAATGQFLRLLLRDGEGRDRPHIRAFWTPDSQRVFVFTEGQGRFWNAETGALVGQLAVDLTGQSDPCFSPDRQRLLTHQLGQATLWDTQTGARLAVLSGPFKEYGFTPGPIAQGTIRHIGPRGSFSPDGRRIVAPSGRTAVVWDGFSGKQLAVLRGHAAKVTGAAFSPDSRWLATWAEDGVRLWYADSGKEFFHPTEQETWWAGFSPDGRWLLTNLRREGAWLQPVDPLAAAHARKSRELTAEEHERFELGPTVSPGP